jgi:hypothetical protein
MKRILLSVLFVPLVMMAGLWPGQKANAQILSSGDLFGPGAPPPIVGIEVGVGEHQQQGTFDCDCGASFGVGSGSGFLGSLVFELPIDYSWAIGIKGGIDFKNITGTIGVIDTAIINDVANQNDTIDALSLNRVAYVKTTYLNFSPYVQYQFFRMGPFVQAGLEVGLLLANQFKQTRQLTGTTATVGGQIFNDLRFTNGTLEETVPNTAIDDNVNKLRLGVVLSAGYNIPVSEKSILSPLLTYDFPLTTIRDLGANGWKIGSLYATVILKFRLD